MTFTNAEENRPARQGGRRERVSARKMRLAPEALAMLSDGVDLRGARLRPWYERD
jgi:transposase